MSRIDFILKNQTQLVNGPMPHNGANPTSSRRFRLAKVFHQPVFGCDDDLAKYLIANSLPFEW